MSIEYDFYRIDDPKEMGDEEINLYESLVGSTRYIKNYRNKKDKEIRKLYFESILTKRELVVLYNAILDDETPVVAKVAVKYKIQQDVNTILENVLYKLGIDIEDVYDEENEDYILTEEQKQLAYPLRDEAIKNRVYTIPFIPEIEDEFIDHKRCYKYAIDHNITPRIHGYYGLFKDQELPVIYYLMERLGKSILESQIVPMENVAIDVITALKAMHKAGYYHRDVTPMNILNTLDGEAVNLIDFGISKPTWAIGSSRGIAGQLMSGKQIGEDEILLQVGNPNFAPAISYLGGYNYAGDLEGLCYTLEALYSKGHLLPWVSKKGKEVSQSKAYKLRLNFVPTIAPVRELLNYVRSIGNEMPDYEKCMDFFLKK